MALSPYTTGGVTYWLDRASGQAYSDPNGANPVAAPMGTASASPAGVYTTAQPAATPGPSFVPGGPAYTGSSNDALLNGLNGAFSTANGAVNTVAGGAASLAGGLGSAGTLPQGDRDALHAAIANTGNASQFYGDQMVNYNPVAAPVAQTPAAIQAAIAQQGAPIQAGTATASTATPAQIQSTATAQQQQAIEAQQVQAAQISAAQQAQAGQVARTQVAPVALANGTSMNNVATASPTQLAPTSLAKSATLDLANANQTRGQQEGLIGSLRDTIAGKSPSVAAIQLRQTMDQNVANQYALAQASTAQNAGESQRQAMINAAGINQTAIGQGALLRAQEIANAQGQLGTNLAGVSGQDVGVAATQAQLQQQVALANQSATNTGAQAQLSADVQTKLANAGFINTQNMTQAQLNQAINLANAGFRNTASTTQAQLDAAQAQLQAQLQTGTSQFNAGQVNTQNLNQAQLSQAAQLANQQANLAAGTTNATLAQQVQLANAAATNATNTANAGYAQAANLQNSQLGTQVSLDNANNTTSANTASAQLANAVNLANSQNQTQANLTTGQLQTQTNLANANNAVSTNALNQKATNDLASNQLTASGQNVTAANNQAQADVGLAGAAATAKGAELNAAATGIAGLAKLSDRREKKDITDSEKEIAAFVRGINPYAWRYKRPELPGAGKGRQYGVMAQDLERSKVGRTLVHKRPDGRREVDVAGAATVALAAISALNKRIDRAEARR
jgi:hypothetical protein